MSQIPSFDKRLNKPIYKSIGEYELTDIVDKANVIKQLQLSSTFKNAMEFEIYKHNNNVYILNKTTLSHYNLQSKQLKEKITMFNQINLYKMIGYFLQRNIEENIKLTKQLKQSNKQQNKIMNALNEGDVYYYISYGYGLPHLKGYKIISKNKTSIKVVPVRFEKKITNKQIKYIISGFGCEETLVKIYKNQSLMIDGYELHKLNKHSYTVKMGE